MNRTPVTSSNIRAVGYDELNQVLEVEFHTGSVYQYLGVPKAVFGDLLAAPSCGTYLNRFIKGRYEVVEID